MGHTERRFWGDLPVHVAGAHPKGRRLRAGGVGPYVVAFMDQGPIADHEKNYVTYAAGDPV